MGILAAPLRITATSTRMPQPQDAKLNIGALPLQSQDKSNKIQKFHFTPAFLLLNCCKSLSDEFGMLINFMYDYNCEFVGAVSETNTLMKS